MVVKKVGSGEVDPAAAPKSRQMSAINYPYFDLKASVEAIEAIHRRGGGVASADQLVAWLGYKTVNSGTFATRLSSMRHFSLLEPAPVDGKLIMTERAKTILAPVMPDDKINALADAFLAVPLFRLLFDRFRGMTIPPDAGLRNLLEHTHKIIPDRVPQAVRVFKDSAEYAGFFKEGADRLIRPSAVAVSTPAEPKDPGTQQKEAPAAQPTQERRGYGGGSGGGDGSGIDTAIIGLLRKLPPAGQTWTVEQQKRFLTAFTTAIEFLYPAKGEADDA